MCAENNQSPADSSQSIYDAAYITPPSNQFPINSSSDTDSMFSLPWRRNRQPTVTPTDPNNAPVFDFSNTPLAEDYPSTTYYIKVLDGVFTPKECKAMIRFAETGVFDINDDVVDTKATDENPWHQAAVNHGMQARHQIVNMQSRNSGRLVRFNTDLTTWLYKRLAPYVKEVAEIVPGSEWETVVGEPIRNDKIWKLVGMYERLIFLRYTPGQFFKAHCDGHIGIPDGRQSRITVQIYLSGASKGKDKIVGGTTRIWARHMQKFVDITPRVGRVLVYQQEGVLHSGEEVKKGVKYALRTEFMFETEEITQVE
ncbi:hypothetical protein AX17_004693 [Amanita inopinata Kibby_2008]|nr:hypothetical protein AX17_004693 [Amanita inopinata Kibby_2008]